jgi:ankyrin repeat protein
MSNRESSGLPSSVLIGGWIVLFVAIPFVGRILWEETFLTCERGPQMIGFSMAHTMPALMLLGVLGLLMAHIWLVVIGFHVFWRQTSLAPVDRMLVVSLILTLVLLYSPQRGWEFLMGRVCGPRQSAAELFAKGGTPVDHFLLKVVLKNHGNVNQPVSTGGTLLGIAIARGDVAAVRILIDRGADVNGMDYSSTPLNEAAEKGDFSIVKALIEAGADPNKQDRDGFSPAGRASAHGHEDIAVYLDSRNGPPAK